MTVAWYGHLKHRSAPIVEAIVISWLIAFGEYCFQVPANRIGHGDFTGYQLKIIQECITLTVFAIFCLALSRRTDSLELRRVLPLSRWSGRVGILGETLKPPAPFLTCLPAADTLKIVPGRGAEAISSRAAGPEQLRTA